MDKIKKLMIVAAFAAIPSMTFAKEVTCPPADLVKAQSLQRVIPYDLSMDLWEAMSGPFDWDGVQWDVAYGAEFPGAKTPQQALKAANEKYKSAAVRNFNPDAIPIPGYIFCDYTHEGMEYWIAAMSPPGGE